MTNHERADRAERAVDQYRQVNNIPDSETNTSVIVDLIADLLHFADLQTPDELGVFNATVADDRAFGHYAAERDERH